MPRTGWASSSEGETTLLVGDGGGQRAAPAGRPLAGADLGQRAGPRLRPHLPPWDFRTDPRTSPSAPLSPPLTPRSEKVGAEDLVPRHTESAGPCAQRTGSACLSVCPRLCYNALPPLTLACPGHHPWGASLWNFRTVTCWPCILSSTGRAWRPEGRRELSFQLSTWGPASCPLPSRWVGRPPCTGPAARSEGHWQPALFALGKLLCSFLSGCLKPTFAMLERYVFLLSLLTNAVTSVKNNTHTHY